MPKVLRPHQEAAVADIIKELKTKDRTTYVSATGTGKTLVMQHLSRELGDLTLVSVPSLILISQMLKAWKEEDPECAFLAVCSDETVAGLDEIVVRDDELIVSGALVTRDPAEIARFLGLSGRRVVFSTYHSISKVAEAQAECGVVFDVAIADEAHYLTGTNTIGIEFIEEESILASKRVFATATPRVVSIKESGGPLERDIVSMDDEEVFGRVSHELTLRDAIDKGLLTDYQIHILQVSQDEILEITGDKISTDADVRMAMGVAAYHRMKLELGVERSIVYLSSKSRARQFSNTVRSPEADTITSEVSAELRQKKLKKLEEVGGVIANVRCLTEGIDIPSLDAIEFIDPRKSKIDIVQAVGRAIRVSEGKTLGHIIIPVLEEPGVDYGEGKSFRPVWDILVQMAENDTALASQIRVGAGVPQEGDEEVASNYDQILHLSLSRKQPELEDGISPDYFVKSLIKKIQLKAVSIFDPIAMFIEKVKLYSDFLTAVGDKPKAKNPKEENHFKLMEFISSKEISPARSRLLDMICPEWRINEEPIDADFLSTVISMDEWIADNQKFPEEGSVDAVEDEFYRFLEEQREESKRAFWSNNKRVILDAYIPNWETGIFTEDNKLSRSDILRLDEELYGYETTDEVQSLEEFWESEWYQEYKDRLPNILISPSDQKIKEENHERYLTLSQSEKKRTSYIPVRIK